MATSLYHNEGSLPHFAVNNTRHRDNPNNDISEEIIGIVKVWGMRDKYGNKFGYIRPNGASGPYDKSRDVIVFQNDVEGPLKTDDIVKFIIVTEQPMFANSQLFPEKQTSETPRPHAELVRRLTDAELFDRQDELQSSRVVTRGRPGLRSGTRRIRDRSVASSDAATCGSSVSRGSGSSRGGGRRQRKKNKQPSSLAGAAKEEPAMEPKSVDAWLKQGRWEVKKDRKPGVTYMRTTPEGFVQTFYVSHQSTSRPEKKSFNLLRQLDREFHGHGGGGGGGL